MSQGATDSESTDLSEEDIHEVLQNRRRRLVIDIIQDSDGPITVRELSEEIGAIVSGTDPPPRKTKQSVYVSLLQTHLPKLDELNIVQYESDGKLVSVREGLSDVTVYMETVPKYGISRSEYYAALSILGLLTVFGAEMSVPGLSIVSGVNWAYAIFLLAFVSAAYHISRQGSTFIQRLTRVDIGRLF